MKLLGISHLYGLSTQETEYQREAVKRLGLPYDMLSDIDLKLKTALNLPILKVDGMTLLKCLTSALMGQPELIA